MGEEPKKIIGPSLPLNFKDTDDSSKKCQDTNARLKHSRMLGPSRPPIGNASQMERTARNRSRSPPSCSNREKSHSVRESWMTEIGEEKNAYKPDSLNIKARTFIQKRTELYKSSDHGQSVNPDVKAKEQRLDEQIKEYNESNRRKTLQEIYEEERMDQKKAQTETDRKDRIFDWERDMNSTVRQMSTKSAKDLVSKSTLNDRFSSSTSKKYL